MNRNILKMKINRKKNKPNSSQTVEINTTTQAHIEELQDIVAEQERVIGNYRALTEEEYLDDSQSIEGDNTPLLDRGRVHRSEILYTDPILDENSNEIEPSVEVQVTVSRLLPAETIAQWRKDELSKAVKEVLQSSKVDDTTPKSESIKQLAIPRLLNKIDDEYSKILNRINIKQKVETPDTKLKSDISKYYDLDSEKWTDLDYDGVLTATHGLRKRTYDPKKLQTLIKSSPSLRPCIDAMVSNIVGGGVSIQKRDVDPTVDLPPNVKKEVDILEEYLANISYNVSFSEFLEELVCDYQSFNEFFVGFRYFTDSSKNKILLEAYRVPCTQVRVLKEESIMRVEDEIIRGGSVRKIKREKSYKRYLWEKPEYYKMGGKNQQATSSDSVYRHKQFFVEWGSPEIIDKYSGLPTTNKKDIAEELYHYRDIDDSTSYGEPIWANQMASIIGQIEAESINLETFKENLIPSLAILMSDMKYSRGDIEQLRRQMSNRGGNHAKPSKILMLRAVTRSQMGITTKELEGNAPARNGKVEFVKLNDVERKELLFGDYVKKCETQIRQAFRLPPILLGQSADYNRATSHSAIQMAEDQIFKPYRRSLEDFINNVLLKHIGLKDRTCKIVFNAFNHFDKIELMSIFETAYRMGGVSPNMAVKALNTAIDMDFQAFPEPYGTTPINKPVERNTPTEATDPNMNPANTPAKDAVTPLPKQAPKQPHI